MLKRRDDKNFITLYLKLMIIEKNKSKLLYININKYQKNYTVLELDCILWQILVIFIFALFKERAYMCNYHVTKKFSTTLKKATRKNVYMRKEKPLSLL